MGGGGTFATLSKLILGFEVYIADEMSCSRGVVKSRLTCTSWSDADEELIVETEVDTGPGM